MQLAIRSRIKFFFRPAHLKLTPNDAYLKVTWHQEEGRIKAVNPTPYYITYNKIAVDQNKHLTPVEHGGMIPLSLQQYLHLKAELRQPAKFPGLLLMITEDISKENLFWSKVIMNANNLSCLIYCRCSLLLFAALGLTVTNHSFAAEEAEFDSEFLHLDKGINVIDIRRFSHGNPVPEGRYYSDIYVNNVWKGKADLQYLRTANTGAPTLCLTPELLSLIDLVKDTMSGNTSCFPASTGLSSASINFDLSTLRLNIEIPQALLNTRPRGYISLLSGKVVFLQHL